MNPWIVRAGAGFLFLVVSALAGNVQNSLILNPAELARREAAAKPPDPNQGLVLFTVSVAGPSGRPIPPIDRDRFHVLEDGVEQKIDYFWIDNRPLTVGFVFDNGGRMDGISPKILTLPGIVPAFFETRIPADEYFVETFSSLTPVMVTAYTTELKGLQKIYPASGDSPLNDAIYLGLELMKEAANPRKILVVVTGGVNGGPGIHDLQLISFAMKQPVQIYPIIITSELLEPELLEADVLGELADITGAHDYLVINNANAVESTVREIARGVRTQYLIGYKAVRHDGRRHGIKVTVDRPEGSAKLKVWTKSGYIADKAPPR